MFRLRPEPKRLTQYFLGISAGGALGGLFVAVIAPRLFSDYWEYHIMLWIAGALFLASQAFLRSLSGSAVDTTAYRRNPKAQTLNTDADIARSSFAESVFEIEDSDGTSGDESSLHSSCLDDVVMSD